ncbi:MAG: DUF1836 domain-containing protein [Clostridia bacterium]|nr:DUF1836 domain-containing protein [Clostridia bacterium]
MNLQEMEGIVKESVRDANLRPEDIPAIDLYLDQITSLAAEKRREGASHYHNRELTKTMINNYSKDGLISPVKGKKYNKEQILQMLLVYELKNTLSIGEIKELLQNVYSLPDYDSRMLEDIYARYLEMKEYQRQNAWDLLQLYINGCGLDPENKTDFFTLLLGMCSMSSYLKSAVQVLLPSMTEELEREEQERREEAKRRRKEEKKAKKAEASAAKEAKKEASAKESGEELAQAAPKKEDAPAHESE